MFYKSGELVQLMNAMVLRIVLRGQQELNVCSMFHVLGYNNYASTKLSIM